MTPLEYAEELRKLAADELVAAGASVPPRTWTQLGDVVIECEALAASVASLTGLELGGAPCDYAQIATITVSVARECANVSNDDGTNNLPVLDTVSAQQDRDSDALWNVAQNIPLYLEKQFTVGWQLTGALAISTLTVTVGVP